MMLEEQLQRERFRGRGQVGDDNTVNANHVGVSKSSGLELSFCFECCVHRRLVYLSTVTFGATPIIVGRN